MIEDLQRSASAHAAGASEHNNLTAEAAGLRSLLDQLQRELAASEREAADGSAADEQRIRGLESQLQDAAVSMRAAEAAEVASRAAIGRHQVPSGACCRTS